MYCDKFCDVDVILHMCNSQTMVAGGSELELQSWPSFKAFPITPP